jgi:NitT/TauT family transport system permease protein
MKVNGQLVIGRFLVLTIVLLTWEIASLLSHRIEFAIARPTTIWTELLDLLQRGKVFPHIMATGGAAFLGLLLGTVLGTLLGLLTWFSRSTATLLRPFVLALGAMPMLAVAPLMIIWFGIGFQMKVALACLSTIFVAFAQSARGAEKVSNDYLQVLRGMNATPKQVFVMAVVPGSMDWVFSGMKVNAGLALLGAFIGEFIASNVGLGYLVLKASSLYNVPRAIAASLFIVALALLFDWLASLVEQHRNKIIKVICIPRSAWRTRG